MTLLFGYGTLERFDDPPKTLMLDEPDTIFGDMFDLGEYPVAINIGRSMRMIKGQVERIENEELFKLDKREEPQFKRIKTRTRKGRDVWVYEYQLPIPQDVPRITKWHYNARKWDKGGRPL